MADQIVSPHTRVRVSRVHNIDTDRLQRRKDHIIWMVKHSNEVFPRRRTFVERAQELYAIENELVKRSAIHTSANPLRYTIAGSHTKEIQHR